MEKYHNTLQEENGDIITTATVTVYLQNTGTLASLKEDDESTALNNPFDVSDDNYDTKGSFFFKAVNGVYDIKVVNGADTTWLYDVSLFDQSDAGLGLGIVDNATSTAMTITAAEDIGIGIAAPDTLVHIHNGSAGAVVGNSSAPLLLESNGNTFFQLLSPAGSLQIILLSDVDDNSGQIRYDHGPNNMTFWANAVQRMTITTGVQVGSPTGGDKGAGTLNATAVYDDNVLLTCYVFDQELDKNMDLRKWDDKVINRVIPAVTAVDGEELKPEQTIKRIHEPLRKFKNKIEGGTENPLDIDQYSDHWKAKRHLTSMPNENSYDPENGAMATGEWIQRLIETVEIQAIHIDNLNQRLKKLERNTP